jgi:NMD3 family
VLAVCGIRESMRLLTMLYSRLGPIVLTSLKGSRSKVKYCTCYDVQCTHSSLASVSFCRNCERFLSPPQTWTAARLESQELLSICLRKLKGLNKVRLTEAHFIWTEPHSKRLRVSLTIQKEVRPSEMLSQCFFLTVWKGTHEHYSRTNIRNRVFGATRPMS